MTGPEHYLAAEACLHQVDALENGTDIDQHVHTNWLRKAGVHATLALAAATALAAESQGSLDDTAGHPAMDHHDLSSWKAAAATSTGRSNT